MFTNYYFGGGIVGIVVTVLLVFAAIAVFIVTATSARKAGAGRGMVWGGGILMTLLLLSAPMQVLMSLFLGAVFHAYDNVYYATGTVFSVLSMALPIIYLIVGALVLIRAAVKAARGPQVMPAAQPPQPYGYGPVGGYPQQPAPPAPPAPPTPGMAPPPPRSF